MTSYLVNVDSWNSYFKKLEKLPPCFFKDTLNQFIEEVSVELDYAFTHDVYDEKTKKLIRNWKAQLIILKEICQKRNKY